MKEFSFTKLTGAGNDFILFDREIETELYVTPDSIKRICDRRFGIGADGVILIEDADGYDFAMTYYNSDGSRGSLCGNGARCSIKYAQYSARLDSRSVRFKCDGMDYSGEILMDGSVKFNLNDPDSLKLDFNIIARDRFVNCSFANTGSPHAVINIADVLKDKENIRSGYGNIGEVPVKDLGRDIRYSKDFAPDGTNVNFIDLKDDKVMIRTYERGVEDETLACGTGAVASALISYLKYGVEPPVELLTKGGEILRVDFRYIGDRFRDLSLTGPAKIVFNGNIILPI